METFKTMTLIDEVAPASERKVFILQLLLGFATSLQLIAPGMVLGYSAVALPQLRADDSMGPLTEEQGSWFASVSNISTPIGCLLGGWILDKYGRKKSLIAHNIPGFIGWMLLSLANGLTMLYSGRLLTGLALGMASSNANLYLGEISVPKLRGTLINLNSIAIALGILLTFVFGWVFTWNLAAACALIPTILSFIFTLFLPESPGWLLSKSRFEDAQRSIIRLRGGGGDSVHSEYESLCIAQEKRNAKKTESDGGLKKFYKNLKKPEFWKPLLIMNIFFFFQQFTGIYVVMFYTVDMIATINDHNGQEVINNNLATVLIAVGKLIITLFVGIAMTIFGRRVLAIFSGIGMTICMAVLTIYSYFFLSTPSIIPVIILIAFIVVATIGFMTLPWVMLGEVFPVELRGVGAGVTSSIGFIMSFVCVKAYPGMLHTLSTAGVFGVYLLFCIAATIFVIKWLPETRGRTLQEIEDSFAGRYD